MRGYLKETTGLYMTVDICVEGGGETGVFRSKWMSNKTLITPESGGTLYLAFSVSAERVDLPCQGTDPTSITDFVPQKAGGCHLRPDCARGSACGFVGW